MPKAPKTTTTKASTAKTAKKGAVAAPAKDKGPIFEKKARTFSIGGDVQPTRDLTRFVKWPRYIRLQRQKRVLYQRLKVPPAVNQFTKTLEKNHATNLFRLLSKYRPEDKAQKKERLRNLAAAKEANQDAAAKKPIYVKYGVNHVTKLIEQKKAQLVVIAHDVDPIELVIFLPALCRKMDVPYAIVKGKARLGQVVHKKTSAVLAITNVRNEDRHEFSQLVSAVRTNFNEKSDEIRKSWGGGINGIKSQAAKRKREKLIAREEAKKNML
jgi:large subunit ribosomal protein L7Ae